MAQEQGTFSIDECVEMACRHYPQSHEYELIDAALKYDLNNASLSWVPQVSLSGKATWQSEVVEMPFDIPGFEFDIPHDQYGITADVTQQIWDGGMSGSRKEIARAGAEVKKGQLAVNLYSIRSQVQKICLGIMLVDKQLELNRLLEGQLQRSIGEISSLIDHGIALQSDKDQLEVNVLTCRQQISALNREKASYTKILGILTGQNMEGVRIIPEASSEKPAYGRPELALYSAQARQVEAQRRQLDANISPKFNLTLQGGYGRPGMNMLSGEFSPYFVAGIKMQWNFGALYTLKNDRRKADTDARKVEYLIESFKMNNDVEAEQKRCEIDKAQAVLADDDRIIELRQNIRESGESQYRQGVLKMNDYLDMLSEEYKARLNKSIHEIQLLMAEYDLKNTLGE